MNKAEGEVIYIVILLQASEAVGVWKNWYIAHEEAKNCIIGNLIEYRIQPNTCFLRPKDKIGYFYSYKMMEKH